MNFRSTRSNKLDAPAALGLAFRQPESRPSVNSSRHILTCVLETQLPKSAHRSEPATAKFKLGLGLANHDALLKNLEDFCTFAHGMIQADHCGFVLFEKTLQRGQVVAQFPAQGFERLLGRDLKLEREAEQRLINDQDAIEILDVDNPTERAALGSVAILLDEFNIKSLYIVKVRIQGDLIGSFSLGRVGTSKEFIENEKTLCRSLAQFASSSIENAVLSDWLEVFQESTKAIISEQETGPLLETIVNQAVTLLEVDEAGIYERHFDHSGDYLLLSQATYPVNDRKFLRAGGGMAWQLIDSNEDFLQTSDYSKYPYQSQQFQETSRHKSVLEVPLIWLNQRIGVLFVAAAKGIEFTEFHAGRLQRIADIATLAIQRCRLLGRIESLSNASIDLTKELDSGSLNARLTAIAAYATKILGAEMCGVFRIRHPEIMTLEAGYGHTEKGLNAGQPFRIADEAGSGLTGAIADRLRKEYFEFRTQGRSEIFKGLINISGTDLTSDPAVKGDPDNSPSGKCHSLLAIPLLSIRPAEPAMTGLLRISNKRGVGGVSKPGIKFTKEDEWILRIFAEAASMAIETAELFNNKDAQFNLFRTFSEVLEGETELDSSLDVIASQLAVVMKKSFCRILFSHNQSRDSWNVRGAGLHPRANNNLHWLPHKGETFEVRRVAHLAPLITNNTNKTYCVGNSNGSGSLTEYSIQLEGGTLHSLLVVPMCIGGELVGALEFGEFRNQLRGRGLSSESEIELAKNPALLTADLLRKDLIRKRQPQMVEALFSAVAKVREVADINELFSVISREARLLLDCDHAGLIIQRFRDGPITVITEKSSTDLEKNDSWLVELFDQTFSSELTIRDDSLEQLCRKVNPEIASGTFLASRLHLGTQAKCALFAVQRETPIFPVIAEREFLGKFATQCSTSLTKIVVQQRLERFRAAMTLLGTAMALGRPIEALKNVLNGIKNATDCDSVVLYKIDSRSQAFSAVFHVGDVNPQNIAPLNELLMETAVGKILKLGDLYVARNAWTDDIMHDPFQQSEHIRSSAGLPIWINQVRETVDSNLTSAMRASEEKVNVGVLFLNYKQPQLFSRDEQQIIRTIAPYVALSIKNQELYEQEQTKSAVRSALLDAEKSLSRVMDLEETGNQIAKEAHRIAEAAGRTINFVVVKLLKGSDALILAAYPRTEKERIGKELNRKFPVDTKENGIDASLGVIGRALRTKKTEIVNDVLSDTDYIGINEDTRSQLSVLLPPGESPIGVISIESSNLNTFYEDDRHTFELFAVSATEAIKKAQQFVDLEEARRREEAARAVASATALAAAISHSYKGAAGAVVRSANKLKQSLRVSSLWPKIRMFFPRSPIALNVDEILSRATGLSDELDTQEFSFKTFPCIRVNHELNEWTSRRRVQAKNEGAQLFFNEPLNEDVYIRMQPDLLVRVLDTLFENALAAMAEHPTRKIWLGARRSKPQSEALIDIVMSNSGPKMPDSTWKSLGVRPVPSGPRHTGMGLLIVRTLIEMCDGQFRKFTNDDEFVSVGFALPIVRSELVDS